MRKARKICCRITPRSLMSSVLIAASMVNLIIVGAVFKVTAPTATPTVTLTHTSDPVTGTFLAPTATEGNLATVTLESPTVTPTASTTPSQTFTFTPTETHTPTPTNTLPPSVTPCVPRYYWPVYVVQAGDTLSSIARATGSSVNELMSANCLTNSLIYVGQQLYVPRLPVTPTYTPTTPPNTPTIFQEPFVCVSFGETTMNIVFSVIPVDPDGVGVVSASYRLQSAESRNAAYLQADGDTYFGSSSESNLYAQDQISFSFVAIDDLGSMTVGPEYTVPLQSCFQVQAGR